MGQPSRLQPGAWRVRSGTQRVLQFTDLHLFAEPNRELFGQRTRATFSAVLEHARQRHWPPDVIVLTGDLVHDERPEGYRYLRQVISDLGVPYHCIPGNHDHLDDLTAELDPNAANAFRATRLGDWDLLLLDSTIADSEGGRLPARTLAAVHDHLASEDGRPALVCVHHQPVPVGSAWIDTMKIQNGDDLIALGDRYPQLRAIVCGHIHQQFDHQRGHTRLLATPSTCAQFAPGRDEFGLDDQPPGYRWLELHRDGSLSTGVERVHEAALITA